MTATRRERARSVDERTDEKLVQDYARAGDREALGEIMRRRWPEAYRLALRVLGDPGAAEDAAQEAFFALVRSAGSFEGGKPFGPWFRTLVMNAARKSSRSAKTRRRYEERSMETRATTVPHEGERKVLEGEVARHVAMLPFKLRVPLVLHFFEGCSYEEVAEVEGCPKPTVQTRIRSGLEQLRRSLAGAGMALALPDLEAFFEKARGQTPTSPIPAAPSVASVEAGAARLARTALLSKLAFVGAALVLATVGAASFLLADQEPRRAALADKPPLESSPAPSSRADPAPVEGSPSTGSGSSAAHDPAPSPPANPAGTSAPTPAKKPASREGHGRLRGIVVEPGGTPVAHARIALYWDTRGQQSMGPPPSIGSGETDGEGRYAVDSPTGAIRIVASHAGYALVDGPGYASVSDEETTAEPVILMATVAVRGVVRGDDGKPLVAMLRGFAPGGEEITSAADGTFFAPEVAEGVHGVYLEAEGYMSRLVPVIALAGEKPVEIVLSRSGKVTGTLRDSGGTPVRGCFCSYRSLEDQAAKSKSFETDASGGFTIDPLAPGSFAIFASPSGEEEALLVEGEVRAGEVKKLDLGLESAIKLEGFLHDASGHALAKTTVHVNDRMTGHYVVACTDEAGRFTARGLAPGRYDVVAYPKGALQRFVAKDMAIDGRTAPVDLLCPAGATVRGKFEDPEPEQKDTIKLGALPLGETNADPSVGGTTVVNEDGHGGFEISDLPPGDYTVFAQKGVMGYRYADVRVHLAPGQVLDDVKLVLAGFASISGRVVDDTGAPVRGMHVRLTLEGEPEHDLSYGRAWTKTTGHFSSGTIHHTGRYVLEVDRDSLTYAARKLGRARLTCPPVTVDFEPGKESTVELRLAP